MRALIKKKSFEKPSMLFPPGPLY